MKMLFIILSIIFCINTSNAVAEEKESTTTEKTKKIGSESVTREKIRALKDKNMKTVDALEDIDEEGDEEEEE